MTIKQAWNLRRCALKAGKTSTRKTENLAFLTYLQAESRMRKKSELGHLWIVFYKLYPHLFALSHPFKPLAICICGWRPTTLNCNSSQHLLLPSTAFASVPPVRLQPPFAALSSPPSLHQTAWGSPESLQGLPAEHIVQATTTLPLLPGLEVSLFPIALPWFYVHCSLFTVHYSLFTVHCSLFTVHCSLFTVHC